MAVRRSKILRIGLLLGGLGVVGAAVAALAVYVFLLRDLPDFHSLEDYRPPLTTTVLDRKGRPIGEFYEYRRRLTPLSEVPDVVVKAFLAAEDDTFYQHGGIDYVSILRAAWTNLLAGGETKQGASTITQQMVKQLLLSPERTYARKIRELVLARRIEQSFSKQEILYLYLNQIYFGSGAYGIGEAARTYFGKDISQVTAGEAALLAGLPKAPGRNSPFLNPKRAEERRRYVLGRMRDEGFIDQATWKDAVDHPPVLAPQTNEDFETAAYFTEEVRRRLVERLGNDEVLHGGLTVQTTLDLDLQRDARQAVRDGVEALDHRQGYRGPLRHVEAADHEAALAALAAQNHLEGVADPTEALTAAPLPGLVLKVDDAAGRARVAFAPGLEAVAPFDEMSWAHDASKPHSHGTQARKVSDVLSVGDVALFRVRHGEGGKGWIAALYQHPKPQGALLSYDVQNGDVLALIGGYDFDASQFDRALQAERQPGSAFKPIVYGTAVTRGFTPATIVYDRPVVYEDETSGFVFRPENYERRFLGPITVTEALARSVNNAAIHVLRDVGIDHVIAFAHRLGIRSHLDRVLGLALGGSSVTLLEITRAYGAFAAGGRLVQPRLITRVLDRDGKVLLEDVPLDPALSPPPVDEPKEAGEAQPAAPEAAAPEPEANDSSAPAEESADEPKLPDGYVMTPQQAYLATALLRAVVDHPHGTGRRAHALGRPLAGKTGTTNDNTDAWFVGFSPEIVTGVWVGIDEKALLGHGETGARAALPIWMGYMRKALADRPVRDFPVPDGIVFARIDTRTGELAGPDSGTTLYEPFLEGTEPKKTTEATAPGDRRGVQLDF